MRELALLSRVEIDPLLCGVRIVGLATGVSVVDNLDAVLLLLCAVHSPRRLHELRRHLGELREPVAHIMAAFVVAFPLVLRDESGELLLAAPTGELRPVVPVCTRVVIDEHRLKVVGAPPPVLPHVDHKVGGGELPASEGHVPRLR